MKLPKKKLTENEQKLYVELLAMTRMLPSSNQAFRQIKVFSENSGKFIRVLIPSFALASKGEVKKRLFDAGHRADMNKEYWDKVYEEITKQTERFILLRYKPGFCGDVYLRTNDKVIGEVKGDKPVLHPNAKKHLPIEAKQGTLKEWKDNVAVLALYSSRIMLALCSAFSGFLLKLLDMEGGGFHLWGTSSMGKSSSAYVLASVAGEPDSIFVLWNNTDKGLEEIAVAHNDSTLILDESKLLGNDPILVAKIIANRVYLLSGGKGKVRASVYENKAAEWLVVVISTGELSLAQHAEDGKIERMEGENVRMIDVPAYAGCDIGVFESLPEDVSSSNELAHIVKDVTNRYYGSAKPAFLKRLVADIQSDSEKLKRNINKSIDYFLDKHNVDRNSGIQVRIAKRFALAYVSGCLAIKYGVFPFDRGDVIKGISKCYLDSLKVPCSPEPTVNKILPKRIVDILQLKEMVDLTGSDGLSIIDVKQNTAVICMVKGKKVIAVDKNIIHECMNLSARNSLLSKLTNNGIMLADSQKSFSTVQIRYEGKLIDRRYCFVHDKLADLLINE